jgi:hypothetical protein
MTFFTSPLGALGGMFIPSFTPRGEQSLLFRRMEGRTDNFTAGDKIHPWGTTTPLGSKFAPRGELRTLEQCPSLALKSCDTWCASSLRAWQRCIITQTSREPIAASQLSSPMTSQLHHVFLWKIKDATSRTTTAV